MKKITTLLFFGLASLAVGNALANCPAPETIRYKCHAHVGGNINCTWEPKFGFYEGSNDPQAHELDTPTSFTKARWTPYSDNNTRGFATCYYTGQAGEQVKLVQSDYDQQSPQPVNPDSAIIWIADPSDGYGDGSLSCQAGVDRCIFQYGELQ